MYYEVLVMSHSMVKCQVGFEWVSYTSVVCVSWGCRNCQMWVHEELEFSRLEARTCAPTQPLRILSVLGKFSTPVT